jgi:hypothetical protein
MKKLILSGMLVAAIAVAAFGIYKNSSKEEELSDMVKANIEALAKEEVEPPPVEIGGSSGGWVTAHNGIATDDPWYAMQNVIKSKNNPINYRCTSVRLKNVQPDGYCYW